VELARPWLGHALLGVNEAGLAAAVVGGGSGGAELPAAPLVQDCLQRFATVEGCLEWCAGRPGDRPATLLLADASGEIAGVELGRGPRKALLPADGRLLAGAASAGAAFLGAGPTACRKEGSVSSARAGFAEALAESLAAAARTHLAPGARADGASAATASLATAARTHLAPGARADLASAATVTLASAATASLPPGVTLAWVDPSTQELRLGSDRYRC
jgi:hypothetical protein